MPPTAFLATIRAEVAQIKLSPCFCLPGKRKTLSLVLVGNQNVIMKSDWRKASFLLQNKYTPSAVSS